MRRLPLSVAIAAALGLCALAWWCWPPSAPDAGQAAARAVPAASAGVSAAPASEPSSASSGTVGQAVARSADDPRCVIRQAAPSAPADASSDARSSAPPEVDPSEQAARSRLLARMSESLDPYTNAVAIWLDTGVDDDDGRLALRRRRLAAVAASTRNPRLYALALRTCWTRPGLECHSLTPRRWSELEPDNAAPWMLMLDEAVAKEDVSGIEEALFHITHARQLAERPLAPLQPIVDAASNDPGSLAAAHAMAIEAIGLQAAQVAPIAYTACTRVTPAVANMWQQCVAMVDVLEHRSDTLMARSAGAAIERRLTGNAEPTRQVAAQRDRLAAFELGSTSSCADLHAKLAVLRRMAIEGDVAVARDLAH